ncbi:MAG: hypothetical protein U5J83_06025 [Bryobacterales bacterium]|nr:hypothetical protein [Bryobacterales bacterium]
MVAQALAALATLGFVLFGILAGTVSAAAQQSPAILDTLRQGGPETLVRSSRFACTMDLHRTQQKVSQGIVIEENASLEVALVDGEERYSLPGEATFRDGELRDALVAGLSGSGSFGGHLRAVLFGESASFGEAAPVAPGSNRYRIPYRVPAARSGYLVNIDGQEKEVATEGEITVSLSDGKPTLEAFTLRAVDLPADFPALRVSESIQFARAGGQVEGDAAPPAFPGLSGVPALATQTMVERSGDEYRNRAVFRECREFKGDASIRFGAGADGPGGALRSGAPAMAEGLKIATRPIPPGVPVDLKLASEIDWQTQRTGDPVEAVISRDVRWKGSTLLNEGARARGRIMELKKVTGKSEGYLLGLGILRGDRRRHPLSRLAQPGSAHRYAQGRPPGHLRDDARRRSPLPPDGASRRQRRPQPAGWLFPGGWTATRNPRRL